MAKHLQVGDTVSSDFSGSLDSFALAATGVVAGTYTLASVTVDAKGRITSISTGTASPVVEVTGTSQTAVSGTRYIANNAALVTITLPATTARGDQIFIRGKGVGGWKLAQNASQVIHGSSDTTAGTGGSLTSQTRYDCVTLECITANTDFLIINQRGTLTTV